MGSCEEMQHRPVQAGERRFTWIPRIERAGLGQGQGSFLAAKHETAGLLALGRSSSSSSQVPVRGSEGSWYGAPYMYLSGTGIMALHHSELHCLRLYTCSWRLQVLHVLHRGRHGGLLGRWRAIAWAPLSSTCLLV